MTEFRLTLIFKAICVINVDVRKLERKKIKKEREGKITHSNLSVTKVINIVIYYLKLIIDVIFL